MANQELKARLDGLKKTLQGWYKELDAYKVWALENDGVIDSEEQAAIDRRTADLTAISIHIAKLERQKGIADPPVAPQKLVGEVDDIQKELDELEKQLK